MWLRHREGENLVCAFFRDALFWRTNRKKTFQAFAEKARTSEETLAVQLPPKKQAVKSNKGIRTLLRTKNNLAELNLALSWHLAHAAQQQPKGAALPCKPTLVRSHDCRAELWELSNMRQKLC